MATKMETDIKPGDTVQVRQKITEGGKTKIQAFEGVVIARKHGREAGATVTVRRVVSGVGVEKTFPIFSPSIEKIEIVRRDKVRRAKLYYLRKTSGKKARLKRGSDFVPGAKEESGKTPEEAPAVDETAPEKKET